MDSQEIANLRQKAYTLAEQYEREYGGCSQCVVAAIKDTVGGISDDVFKAATGLAGGVGLTGNTCGALTGGVMALSCFLGREYSAFDDPKRVRFKTFDLAADLQKRLESEFGSSLCRDIQTRIMGRYYDLRNEEEHALFLKAGGHDDKCPSVCGKAAAHVIDILYENDLI
jgi:C_GCAxxG_C_C family probable redox protein